MTILGCSIEENMVCLQQAELAAGEGKSCHKTIKMALCAENVRVRLVRCQILILSLALAAAHDPQVPLGVEQACFIQPLAV